LLDLTCAMQHSPFNRHAMKRARIRLRPDLLRHEFLQQLSVTRRCRQQLLCEECTSLTEAPCGLLLLIESDKLHRYSLDLQHLVLLCIRMPQLLQVRSVTLNCS
jgi:hypothetical protein